MNGLQLLSEENDRIIYVGTTLVVCFSGNIQQSSEAVITFEWSIDRNVSHISIDPRELVTDSMETCNQPPGWHFDCDCLKDQFPTFETIQRVSALSDSRYKTYEMVFYDDNVSSQEGAVQREKCFPYPNRFITMLVVDTVMLEDKFSATMAASIRNTIPQTRTFDISPGK